MLVKLTYFRLPGKFYSEGSFETDKELLFEICDDVRELLEARRLPGLVKGHSDFIVSVDVPDHPHNHPRLIMPEPLRRHMWGIEQGRIKVADPTPDYDLAEALNG